jgi:hypothetical protein
VPTPLQVVGLVFATVGLVIASRKTTGP